MKNEKCTLGKKKACCLNIFREDSVFTERVIKILFVCAFFDGGEEMFMSFFFSFFQTKKPGLVRSESKDDCG